MNRLFSTLLFALLLCEPVLGANFFRVEKNDSGDWRLLDPEGKPFYLKGLNHYGDGTHMPWNLAERYGDAAAWRKALPGRLKEWGFNYLPPSIGPSAINPATLSEADRIANRLKIHTGLVTRTPEWSAEEFAAVDYPFTIFLEYPRQYMAGPKLPDVFSKAFHDAVDERCREVCEPLKNNRMLIGYHYCHNPPWHPRTKSFDTWIDDIVKPDTAAMREWIALMRRVYGSIERWRETYGYPIKTWDDIGKLVNGIVSITNRFASMIRTTSSSETVTRFISNRSLPSPSRK